MIITKGYGATNIITQGYGAFFTGIAKAIFVQFNMLLNKFNMKFRKGWADGEFK